MSKQKCKGLRMDTHYKIHSTDLVTDRPVPVDQDMLALVRTAPPPLATLHQWEEMEKTGRAWLGIMSMNEYFMAAIRHHVEAVRLSEEDPDMPPAEKEPFNYQMVRRLTDSLVEATRHITDLVVKQVSQAVLVSRNAYLAKAPLTDRVKKPLRAQPLESPKLFAGKMVEALDLDREERKAQPAKQAQTKFYRLQSQAATATPPPSRIKPKVPEIIIIILITILKGAATTTAVAQEESPPTEALPPNPEEAVGNPRSQPPSPLTVQLLASFDVVRPLPHIKVGGSLIHFFDQWSKVTSDQHILNKFKKWNNSFFRSAAESIQPTGILEQTRQKLGPSVLKYPGDASKRRNRKGHRKLNRILQSSLPGTQENRRPSSNNQLKIFKQSHSKSKKFKMETQRAIRKALTQGDWVTSIDLKDAYFHILVRPTARKYLRFTHLQEVYQFKALPFGLTSAPREFSRVTETLGAIAHRQSINLHLYLDDWLLRARSFQRCRQDTATTLRQTNSLGFIINEEKSELVPTQQFSFLGEDYDLALGLVRPTLRKYHQIGILCRLLKKHPLQEARLILKVLGVMNAMADVIPLGRLHMRPLQLYLLSQWSMSTQPLSYQVFLNSKFQEHLLWWTDIHNIRQGKLLHLPTETETL